MAKLSQPPKVARPLKGPGRLPLAKNLITKSPEELIGTLKRFGIEPDLALIAEGAKRAYSRLERVISEGVEPDAATWESIQKSIEKEVAQTVRKITKQAIRLYRFNKLDGGGKFAWVGVGTGMCPSCEPRHGLVKTMAEWRKVGLPGSSALICERECRCNLVPQEE